MIVALAGLDLIEEYQSVVHPIVLAKRLSRRAHSHVVHGVVEIANVASARFNGLNSGGLSQGDKDVKTPSEFLEQPTTA